MNTETTNPTERLGRNPFAKPSAESTATSAPAAAEIHPTPIESADAASPREIARALFVDLPIGLTLSCVRLALEARASRRAGAKTP